jgi:hypothetical protein
VTFASGWALAGLVLLAPLIALHLRDRGRPVREVPSLVVWQELELAPSPGDRGLRLPALPLLLVLQAAALIFLVVALARPHSVASTPPQAQVVVLDDSMWMAAPGRLASAERSVEQIVGALPAHAPVRIVLADGAPRVLYSGHAKGVPAALARVKTSDAPDDLASALTVASGQLTSPHDRVTLIRAPEDPLPAVNVAAGELSTLAVGTPIADQGIFDPSARCGIGAADVCAIFATVHNSGTTAVSDRYTAQAAGHSPLTLHVRVPAGGSVPIVLTAQPDEQVSLSLHSTDALPADNTAWVTVPGQDDLPSTSVVTLVGTPAQALPLARAFASIPGVTLRLRTPSSYVPGDARVSDLVVLDGSVPKGALPAAPAVLLVDPPRLGSLGQVGPVMTDTVLSGSDAGSELLDGVDLSSLDVTRGAAVRLTLARWLAPVAWTEAGPLLAAGNNGHQRVAVLSFDPGRSDLPQLASFPVLAANFVRWSAWAPSSATAGQPIGVFDATPGTRTVTSTQRAGSGGAVERVRSSGQPVALRASAPGLYDITETGPGVSRQAVLNVNASAPAAAASAAPVDLLTARVGARASGGSLAAWFLTAALIVLLLEWIYWSALRRRAVA